jgi:bifunctional DNA-binding transcriptional regulator/antitoxin component of YhaV-PrlF toxin-antitoxin module
MTKMVSINPRGTVTLPKPMRRRLGIPDQGGQLLAEETAQGILLRPGAVLPIEIYSPQRVAEFRRQDEELAPYARSLKRPPARRKSR